MRSLRSAALTVAVAAAAPACGSSAHDGPVTCAEDGVVIDGTVVDSTGKSHNLSGAATLRLRIDETPDAVTEIVTSDGVLGMFALACGDPVMACAPPSGGFPFGHVDFGADRVFKTGGELLVDQSSLDSGGCYAGRFDFTFPNGGAVSGWFAVHHR